MEDEKKTKTQPNKEATVKTKPQQEKQKKLADLTMNDLKALAFDFNEQLKTVQSNYNQVYNEIAKRVKENNM